MSSESFCAVQFRFQRRNDASAAEQEAEAHLGHSHPNVPAVSSA
jgi:hypothetical protein